MKKYWLAITDEYNHKIIKDNGIYATNSESKYKLLNKGDKIILYLVPKRISGIFEIIKLTTNKKIRFPSDKFIYYFEIKPIIILQDPMVIDDKWNEFDLISNLLIFKNAKRWGSVLMGKSILQIQESDYIMIKNEIVKKSGNKK